MRNRYKSREEVEIERQWHVGRAQPARWWDQDVFPRGRGAVIRRAASGPGECELAAGQWGLIPWFTKSPDLKYSTNNARSEELAHKAAYREPWARGQRCIIPARSFDEPCWETGQCVWWRFRPAAGGLWGLAGLWNTWTNRATCEIHENYTMLTINADHHPLMRRMHKPKPKMPTDRQDKRSVIPITLGDSVHRLHGSLATASALLKLPPAAAFDTVPLSAADALR